MLDKIVSEELNVLDCTMTYAEDQIGYVANIVGLSLGRVSITIYSIYFANYATICRVQAKVLLMSPTTNWMSVC